MNPDHSELVAQYHKLVMSLIHRYYGGKLSADADDLAQDIWIKLLEALKKNERNIVNFKSYLYRTVQTTLWDAVRGLEKEEKANAFKTSDELGREKEEWNVNARLALEKLLQDLPPEEERMIRAHLKGFNNQEIGVLLGCSEGRVRNLLTRIKKKLATLGAV